MSKLTTYRISYRVSRAYDIEIKASSADEAEVWARMYLDRTKTPLVGSRTITSDIRICDVQMAGSPLRLPIL
jgi:hypothetical protein